MTAIRGPQGIGSFFASSTRPDSPRHEDLPWAALDTVYVQSGRQALRLLSELLWDGGFRRLILPSYLCSSMIEPFATRDWTMFFSPFGKQIRPDVSSFDDLCADRPEETVALVAEYFGRSCSTDMQRGIGQWMDQGVAVIEDRSHNLLDDRRPVGTYSFGSLRKLLPVADGCFINGLAADTAISPRAVDPSVTSWRAMDLKSAGSEADPDVALREYRAAESEFEVAMDAAPISSRSLHELPYLDITAMRAARKANFETLRELTQDMTVLNDDCADGTPSFLVLQVADSGAWQHELAAEGVFCPIHWSRPEQVPSEIPWRTDLISVPIDHRYGRRDMEHVARSLAEVARRLD